MARFLRWLARGIGVAVAVVAGHAAAAPEPVVSAVTIAAQPGFTRLVLELSERARYQLFLLNEPMRLVLDLPPSGWNLDAQPVSAGVVSGYRYGQFDSETARLVVDLAAPARIRHSGYELQASRKSHRLVIELEAVSAEAFAANVQPWVSSGAALKTPAPPPSIIATARAAPPPPPARPSAAPAPGTTSASLPAAGAARSGRTRSGW